MKEICKGCHYYNEHYTKGYDCFNKTRSGFCNKHKSAKRDTESCEGWRDNGQKKEARERLSLKTLDTSLKYIKEIAQILKEDKDCQ